MRSALAFLTIFGGAAPPDARAARWFAPVGALVGAIVGAAWWGADQLWPALLAAALVVILDAAVTGMLHLDGLADAGDGLLAPMDRARRLAVMREPGIGAFGVVVLVSTLLLRVGALASLAPDILLVAGLWAASRGIMAVVMATLTYARVGAGGGLATAFGASGSARNEPSHHGGGDNSHGRAGKPVLVAGASGTLAALALVVVAGGFPAGPAAASGLVAGGALVVLLGHRRLGGFTGDVLGAAGVVGETCGLLLAAAQW